LEGKGGSRIVVVVGATNRLDLLDPAILRAGRFGFQIFVPLPNEEDRKDILGYYLKGVPFSSETNLNEVVAMVARESEGFFGADLKSLCQDAKICALCSSNFKASVPLKMDYFVEAITKVASPHLIIRLIVDHIRYSAQPILGCSPWGQSTRILLTGLIGCPLDTKRVK